MSETAKPGKVYLVGAGPGDPGLLTRRGAELIGRAEVIVYDFLANPELLALAGDEAEIIYVGKKGGDHALAQERINDLLKEKALAGKMVVRLKGGDPFVFGRGGEEAEELVEAGVDFEIVPGVTSAVAAPAYAGIPLTHRAFNSCLTLATGHEDPTKPASSLNWRALAETGGTLAFLMGMKNLAANSRLLIEAGLAADTPAAIIQWGTTPRQRVLVSTLGDIAAEAEAQGFGPPSIFVVGRVVELRDRLAWLEKRPLHGLRVLITRTRGGASKLAALLAEQGAEPIVFPTIKIVPPDDFGPLDRAIADLSLYDWLIFTSANGVRYFFDRLAAADLDSRALGGLKIAAIGPATAAALGDFGLRADLVPAEYRAEAAVAALAGEAEAGRRFLLPRAEEARQVLPRELAGLGGKIDVVTAYKTVLPDEADVANLRRTLAEGGLDLALFTASSTVKNLARLFPGESLADLLAGVKIGVIGPITAETAQELGLSIDVQAGEYTLAGLVGAVIEWRSGRR